MQQYWFKAECLTKEIDHMLIKLLAHQEYIILNLYALSILALKYLKKNMTYLQGHIINVACSSRHKEHWTQLL